MDNGQEKTIPVAERFRQLMDEPQSKEKMEPIRIIFPDGREVITDKLVGYIAIPNDPENHKTIIYGSLNIRDLIDAKISCNREIDNLLKRFTGDLAAELKKGLPGSNVSVSFAAVPAELIEHLKKKMG